MTGGEAILEQLDDICLTAGGGQAVEIKVVDVNVTFAVSLGVLGAEQVSLVVGLGACSADLEHRAHGGVAVDVGIVTLHIADTGIDVGDLVDGLHQLGVGLSGAGTVGAVQDVSLCCGVEAVVHQLTFYGVLNGFNVRGLVGKLALQLQLYIVGNTGSVSGIAVAGSLQGLQNCGCDLVLVVQNNTTVALNNGLNHLSVYPFCCEFL